MTGGEHEAGSDCGTGAGAGRRPNSTAGPPWKGRVREQVAIVGGKYVDWSVLAAAEMKGTAISDRLRLVTDTGVREAIAVEFGDGTELFERSAVEFDCFGHRLRGLDANTVAAAADPEPVGASVPLVAQKFGLRAIG